MYLKCVFIYSSRKRMFLFLRPSVTSRAMPRARIMPVSLVASWNACDRRHAGLLLHQGRPAPRANPLQVRWTKGRHSRGSPHPPVAQTSEWIYETTAVGHRAAPQLPAHPRRNN